MDNLRNINNIIESERLDYTVRTAYHATDKQSLVDTSNIQFETKFDNTQLACDLQITDSIETGADEFKFTVWNLPENTFLTKGDVFVFTYYWESAPNQYSMYVCRAVEVATEMDDADVKTTSKGSLMDESLIYDTKTNKEYPKITLYTDIKNILSNIYKLNFTTDSSVFDSNMPIPEPIFTRDKSIGEILDDLCTQADMMWKISKGTVAIFHKNSISDSIFDIPVIEINYNDLFKYTQKDDGIEIETSGLTNIIATQVLYLDTSNTPAFVTQDSSYYVVDEITTSITSKDGFFSTVYMHEVGDDV